MQCYGIKIVAAAHNKFSVALEHDLLGVSAAELFWKVLRGKAKSHPVLLYFTRRRISLHLDKSHESSQLNSTTDKWKNM